MHRVRPWFVWALVLTLGATALACGSSTPSQPSPQPTTPPPAAAPPPPAATPPPAPPPPAPPPAPNNRPTVTLAANTKHADIGRDINLTATITDDETQPSQMTVEWSAEGGTFTTTGLVGQPDDTSTPSAFVGTRTSRWRSPFIDKGPIFYNLTVRVTERYTGADGPTEHVVTASYRVAVNNAQKELADLGGGFLDDFANSANSPEYCVRNFSDICVGKRQEIADIRRNRERYTIISASWSVTRIDVDHDTDWATMVIRARFVSHVKGTTPPRTETAVGDSLLTAIYVDDRWYLCESRWAPISTTIAGAAFWQ